MTLIEAVEAMQAGNEAAFPVIYRETSGQAMAIIRRYCTVSADCEDLLQDTYVQVYKYISQLKDPKGIQSWVNIIAKRMAIAHLKKQKAHPQQSFSEMETEDGQLPEFEDEREEIHPELVADRKAVTEIVNQILALLTPEQRDALMMVYGQKMTIREMAGQLGISENTIKSRLHQGKQKLMAYKGDFRRLGVELPVVGIATVLAVAFEENMAAEAAGLAISSVTLAGGKAAGESSAAAATEANAGSLTSAGGISQASAASETVAAGSAVANGGAVGAAGGMTLAAKAVIAVAAAAVIAGGGMAVKTMVLDPGAETEAAETTAVPLEESTAAETEAEIAASEPTELMECFGLSADEIIAKYGEPIERYGGEGVELETLSYSEPEITFVLEADADANAEKHCQTIYCGDLAEFIDDDTDIFDFLAAIDGQVRGYYRWTAEAVEEDGEDAWRGKVGETEVQIASSEGISYRFFLEDPNVLTLKDRVVFQRSDTDHGYAAYNVIGTEDRTAEFQAYLSTYDTIETQEQKEAELAAAYYEMLQSEFSDIVDPERMKQLKWRLVDLDGDGTDEFLFAFGSNTASCVGIGKMADGKAVYCGGAGSTGCITYYPGTGKLYYEQFGAGGSNEGIISFNGAQLQVEADAAYETKYNEATDDDDIVGYSGEINGSAVSTEEAQAYIDDFTTQHGGEEILFDYDNADNRSYAELAALAEGS